MVHGLVRAQTRPQNKLRHHWTSVICEKRNDWLWSKKSPYFVFFQINISFKISVALLRNLCGNLHEKFVSDKSSGLKEMFQGCIWMRRCLDKILGFLVQQVTFPPPQRESLSREGLGYN